MQHLRFHREAFDNARSDVCLAGSRLEGAPLFFRSEPVEKHVQSTDFVQTSIYLILLLPVIFFHTCPHISNIVLLEQKIRYFLYTSFLQLIFKFFLH